MEKSKNNKKIAFYKRNRKVNPKITNEELKRMWDAKVEAEKPKPVEAKPEVKVETKEFDHFLAL